MMFKRISPKVMEEYGKYIKAHRLSFIAVCLLILILTFITPFEFWTGIKLMTAVGAIAFEVTEKVPDVKYYIIAFACLLVSDKLLTWIFNKLRFSILIKAKNHIILQFEKSPGTYSRERAYYCKDAFGEAMDQLFVLTREALLSVSLAAFTVYVNPYAGIPFVIVIYINMWYKIKKKEESAFLRTAVMLLLQAYFISLIFLIMFHIVSYGGFLGYYCSIMFRIIADKNVPDEWQRYLTEASRTEVLEEYFKEASVLQREEALIK